MVNRECQSVYSLGVGETGTGHVPMNVINSQSWGSKPYLSTDRRIMYRPSGIQAYLLQDITILTSISVLDMLLRYSYQSQDNDGTFVACEDEHHHIATCMSLVSRGRARHKERPHTSDGSMYPN